MIFEAIEKVFNNRVKVTKIHKHNCSNRNGIHDFIVIVTKIEHAAGKISIIINRRAIREDYKTIFGQLIPSHPNR